MNSRSSSSSASLAESVLWLEEKDSLEEQRRVLAPGRVRGRLAHVVLAVGGLRGLTLRRTLARGAVPVLQLCGQYLQGRGGGWLGPGPEVNQ